MAATTATNSRVQQGEETRKKILKVAVEIASRQGLGALSIGSLARELHMSKSGLFAHFGSKEDLQIATIETAEKIFAVTIVKPARDAKPGLTRLVALLEGYMRYIEQSVSGGCFFSAAAAEFDDRPGRVRDRIAISMHTWCVLLESEARLARELGELDPCIDTEQLSFELESFTHHANFSRRLLSNEQAFGRARRGIFQRLWSVAARPGRRILSPSK